MAIKREEVFVIRKIDFKESDQIVRLFGKKRGKFSGIAKGARKLSSKFGSVFDLLNRSEVVFYQSSGISFISEAEVLDNWEGLRESGRTINVGLRCARFINRVIHDDQPEPGVYELFYDTIDTLDRDQSKPNVLELGFYFKGLKLLGYEPQLEECNQCGKHLEEEIKMSFQPDKGGLVCSQCSQEKSIPIAQGDRKSLMQLLNLPQRNVVRLKMSGSELKKYYDVVNRFTKYHLDQEVVFPDYFGFEENG